MILTPSEIEGRRVLIRRIRLGDADPILRLINDKEIVRWTIQIPHPYPADGAMKFIRTCQRKWRRGEAFVFAETLKESREFIGVISLSNVALKHGCAELGFWTGKPHWGKGFTSEAVGLTLRFAFEELGLHRIYASTFEPNVGSKKVLEKNGFKLEGVMREAVVRYDQRHDFLNYGILSQEFSAE
ncbi:MAG TPA: GNAT family N-acetyltransferase [Acidobacteriota bacterium]|nr:GNAT family N-acetyltransferase [Acidobacteriota bacterium]